MKDQSDWHVGVASLQHCVLWAAAVVDDCLLKTTGRDIRLVSTQHPLVSGFAARSQIKPVASELHGHIRD
jgi:hypothetical protein